MSRHNNRWIRFGVMAGLLLALAVAAAVPAQAQEPEQFVDLSVDVRVADVTYTQEAEVYLWITNRGNRVAYDVDVEFQVGARLNLNPLVGTYNTDQTYVPPEGVFKWNIPEMPAHAEYSLSFSVGHSYNRTILRHYNAEVTSSSYERSDRLHNNEAKAWEIWWAGFAGPAEPDYSVRVSAENVSSSSADFKVRVVRPDRDEGESVFKDGCVNVWLTSGLTAGSPTFTKLDLTDSVPVAATGRSFDTSASRECGGSGDATGVFNLPEYHTDLESIMTLPVMVNSGATLSEQCLTAEIFATPRTGPGRFYDDPADNLVKVCLGVPPDEKVVFSSGQTDLFTWYDCSEETTGPCDNSVSLELVTLGGTAALEAGAPYRVFDPNNLVVHIPDPAGRATSSETDSIALVWSTGFEEPDGHGHGHHRDRPGIFLVEDLLLDSETTADTDQWSGPESGTIGTLKVEVSGPGQLSTWYHYGSDAVGLYGAATNGILYEGVWWEGRAPLWAEFNALGTYELTMTITSTYDNDTTDTTDGVEYTDMEIYTFHVGPIADLGVSGESVIPNPAPDQYALSVAAFNNGPDQAIDAGVEIDLALPAGVSVVDYVASDGNYSGGTWNLGELKTRDYRRSQGKREEATLTFVLAGSNAANATATATIANATDYTVCIGDDRRDLAHTTQTTCEAVSGASWHEGTVYDYNPDNNTATITAARGTGGVGPGIPRNPRTQAGTTTVMWDDVEYLYGLPVASYQVEGQSSDWTMLEDEAMENQYADLNPEGRSAYRVRAVNAAGVAGPWSPSIAPTVITAGAPGQPALTTAPREGQRRERILLSWAKPLENGSPITKYQLQVSDHSGGPWSDVSPRPVPGDGSATETYTYPPQGQEPLTGGTTKHFRMLARNDQGDGPWSDVVSAKTDALGQAGPPISVSAYADLPPDDGSVIIVEWDAPADDGGTPIIRYEIQWSATGAGGWRHAGYTADGQTLGFRNTGLNFAETRYYRVAAHNSQGRSEWSDPSAPATTAERDPNTTPPGAPRNLVAFPGKQVMKLTWDPPAKKGDPATDDPSINGYRVQYRDSGSGWQDLSVSPKDTTVTMTGMANGMEYQARVAAWNGAGTGPYTAPVSGTPHVLPGTPGGLRLTPGDGQLTVKWDQPRAYGVPPLNGYSVQYRKSGTDQWKDWTHSGTGTTATITGLTNGTEYQVQVAATSSQGKSSYTEPASAKPAVPTG